MMAEAVKSINFNLDFKIQAVDFFLKNQIMRPLVFIQLKLQMFESV